MSWFSTMLSGGVDKIVDSVGTAVDKIILYQLVVMQDIQMSFKQKLQR
jgi:hypothetical protein